MPDSIELISLISYKIELFNTFVIEWLTYEMIMFFFRFVLEMQSLFSWRQLDGSKFDLRGEFLTYKFDHFLQIRFPGFSPCNFLVKFTIYQLES